MNLVKKWRAPEEEQKGANEKVDKPKEEKQDNVDLAKAYKDLKESTVSKEEYEKLKGENAKLLNEVINGGGGSGSGQATPTQEKPDIDKLRAELYGPKGQQLTNLQVVEKTLQLRKAIMDEGGMDPFLPVGANIKPDDRDRERAQAVADVFEECVKEANGDSGVFTALLMSKTSNDSIALTNHLKKLGIK